MAHGKMKSVYGIYKKHGRDQFLDAAGYYSCHVHPESIDKTIDEMESRWYDATHRQTEAEKMVEDYNNGLTVLNDASLAYADYIATRPRAERFGSHGLFTDDGVRVKLEDVSRELNEYEGNVWTVIISLRREDAERLGFNSGERWRDMLRTQTEAIAKNFKIPVEDLKWYAAFHNESHLPRWMREGLAHTALRTDCIRSGSRTGILLSAVRSACRQRSWISSTPSQYRSEAL